MVDSVTTKYFLDGSNVIADYDGNNLLLATYITPGLDANLSQTRDSAVYYYMKDGLGSVRNLVNAAEGAENVYDYYAFGKELGSWTEGVENRYTYTAREYDTESEQYYYRARYYSGNGRFLSRDPAHDGLNIYLYVGNEPLRILDPTGAIRGTGQYTNCCPSPSPTSTPFESLSLAVVQYPASTRNTAADVAHAKEVYRQCCIIIRDHPPVAATLADQTAHLGILGGPTSLDIPDMAAGTTKGPEVTAMTGSGAQTNESIWAYYVASINGDPNLLGFSMYPPDPFPPSYSVAVANPGSTNVLSHEIGHVLLNRGSGHRPGDPTNLMYNWDSGTNTTILPSQCTLMRAHPLVN